MQKLIPDKYFLYLFFVPQAILKKIKMIHLTFFFQNETKSD